MNITLRKASQFSKALIEAGRKTTINRLISVSVYEDSVEKPAQALVELAQEAAREKLTQALHMITGGYELRGQIAKANADVGINLLLTEQANLSAHEALISTVCGIEYTYDDSVEPQYADAKLTTLKKKRETETVMHHDDHLNVRVITDEIKVPLKDSIAVIRRRKAEIADELTYLNASTRIEVSENVQSLLKALKLI
ncbi:hypothetical protein CcrColossus_gp272 [Caulobacter phage CcrColossus]|uniref:Uncharacterized protein n=1 Tax=Caulobacter phage CcrColossus TaxID=1211640 RepID=K4K6G4_9CAUD|nr:hypothetical protein CcrColossus_gp272 [Caulobacter phage CcrColossus]AFU88142.1 hypothetical protein CcrColossus_gp272 [Caulobacter phage CcrColossus]